MTTRPSDTLNPARAARPTALVRLAALVVAVLWAVMDLGTKSLAETSLARQSGHQLQLTSVFDLTLSYNAGVTFGMGRAVPAIWILLATSLIAAAVAWALLRAKRPSAAFALALVLGGALGNIIDRAPDGLVTDFLDFHLRGLHWPAFNIADVGIVAGVIALLGLELMPERRRPRSAEGP